PDGTSAAAAIGSIRQAVSDVVAGRASAVVTNPIAKSVLYRAGFEHPGHTEFIAEIAAFGGKRPQPQMMLWSPALAVVPVTVPLPAATTIHQAPLQTSDFALCMYPGQALSPIKTLSIDDAANGTLGLPFIRTSPDHGPAFDIAGSGRANPSSLVAALRLADRM